MTVNTTNNRVSYAGNGSTTAFSYPNKFLDDAHLVVIIRVNTTGVETTKTITTHYTVTGEGEASGGTVTMVTAPAAGETLIIYQDPAATQDLDLVENDEMPAEEIEERFDKLTIMVQRLKDRVDRTVRLSDGFSPTFTTALPVDLDDAADCVPLINTDGDGWADVADWPTATEIINAAGDASDAAASAAAAAASATAAAASTTDAGQHVTTASRWATKSDGSVVDADTGVDSNEYSSKAYAIGGTGITDTAGKGAAKEWAIETASTVDTSEYSAKEYAVGTQRRGAANGGSSKDWATYTGGTVDNSEYSAKKYAQDSATSAASAATAAAAVGNTYDKVVSGNGGAYVTHTTFAAAVAALSAGDRVLLVDVNDTLNATLTISVNDVHIEGRGIVNLTKGTATTAINITGSRCTLEGVRLIGFNGGADVGIDNSGSHNIIDKIRFNTCRADFEIVDTGTKTAIGLTIVE